MDSTIGEHSIHNSEQGPQDGLTKREYFAAKAMQGLLSNPYHAEWMRGNSPEPADCFVQKIAVKLADGLIKALYATEGEQNG